MEFGFATEALRECCEKLTVAERELGPQVAQILRVRLSELEVFDYVESVVTAELKRIPDSDPEQIRVDLCDGYSLVFQANQKNPPRNGDGGIDWSQIYRIQFMKIDSQ